MVVSAKSRPSTIFMFQKLNPIHLYAGPGYVKSNEVDYSDEPHIKMLHEKIKKTIKGTKRSLNNNDTISVEVNHANGE